MPSSLIIYKKKCEKITRKLLILHYHLAYLCMQSFSVIEHPEVGQIWLEKFDYQQIKSRTGDAKQKLITRQFDKLVVSVWYATFVYP